MQKFKSVDELVNKLRPSKPVYCIRTSSIRTASNYFQKNFPGKILYAVKTNPHPKVLKTIIDIGAWWGPWTLWWGSRAKTIEAFEPNPDILADLKQNTNKLKNCTIHNTALGDITGNVSMQYETHSGTYHIKISIIITQTNVRYRNV